VFQVLKKIITGTIRFYQIVISPLKPPTCRFYPSCSHYGLEAVQRFGPLKGMWLIIKRIGKCHPFHPGGIDPVPEKWSFKQKH
jgi:putative membrane protein insertion efficiency factor